MLESVPVNLCPLTRTSTSFSQGAGLHLIGISANEQVGMTSNEVLKTRDPGLRRLPPPAPFRGARSIRDRLAGTLFETRVERFAPRRRSRHRRNRDRRHRSEESVRRPSNAECLFRGASRTRPRHRDIDAEDTIIRINGQFTTMRGYTDHEAIGMNINDLIVPDEFTKRARSSPREDGWQCYEPLRRHGWPHAVGSYRSNAVRGWISSRESMRCITTSPRASTRRMSSKHCCWTTS
jgi:PAS domain-containing protein